MERKILEVSIYDKNRKFIDGTVIIADGKRVNYEKLKKYTCNDYQWTHLKYSIDLLNDYGFNYFKNGINTNGLENFIVYDYGELLYYIKIYER